MFLNRRKAFLFAYSAKVLLFVLAMALLVRALFVSGFSIQTEAMSPTLQAGDFILAWKTFDPQRGDVVILSCPDNGNTCIKRVVGLPGDRIEIRKQRLIVNARPADYEKQPSDGVDVNLVEKSQDNSWLISVDSSMPSETVPVVVPPDHLFLLNDHRSDLSDSRQWGPVSKFQMEAKAWRIWLSIDWEKSKLNWRRLLAHID